VIELRFESVDEYVDLLQLRYMGVLDVADV
jgi:hypothetical protein